MPSIEISELAAQLIVDAGMRLSSATLGVLEFPDGDELVVRCSHGTDMGLMAGRRIPCEGTHAGHAFTSGVPVVLSDVMSHPSTRLDVIGNVRVRATVMLPLTGPRGPLGVLALARSLDAPSFEPDDVACLQQFANRAGALIQAELVDELRRSAVAAEHRMRDVMGFRDHVMTELFEVIQALTFTREQHSDHELRLRLEAIMSELRRAEFSVAR